MLVSLQALAAFCMLLEKETNLAYFLTFIYSSISVLHILITITHH